MLREQKTFKNLPSQAIGTAKVLYDYKAQKADELSLFEGTKVFLFERARDDWWRGQSGSAVGWFPGNYIGHIQDITGRGFHYAMSEQVPQRVCAICDFESDSNLALTFKKGEIFEVICRTATDPGWYQVRNAKGQLGQVPLNYVRAIEQNSLPNQAIGTAKVLYDYKAQKADELSLFEGTKVLLFERSKDGWWRGQSGSAVGWFPGNYIGHIQDNFGRCFRYAISEQLPQRVFAIYDFESENNLDLSFKKGDIFEVICRPLTDPGWYQVRNASGRLGRVPLNYVKPIENCGGGGGGGDGDGPHIEGPFKTLTSIGLKAQNSMSSLNLSYMPQQYHLWEKSTLAGKRWYYGAIKRAQCETLLDQHGECGDFLIRDSESFKNDYVISLRTPNSNKHFLIRVEHNSYQVGQRKFETLDDIVQYYQRYPICTTDDGEKMCLVRPLSDAENFVMSLQSYY